MENTVIVNLPVNSTAIQRQIGTGSYLHGNTPISINSYVTQIPTDETNEATATITTSINHNLTEGGWVFIDGETWSTTMDSMSHYVIINGNTRGDTWNWGRLNGLYQVHVLTDNSFSITISNLSGIYEGPSATLTITDTGTISSISAPVDTTFPGPYIFDPVSGIAITNTSTSLNQTIFKGTTLNNIAVTSTVGWPTTPGWLVIGYGTSLYDKPIKYLGLLDTTHIYIDQNYVFPKDLPINTDITLLYSKGPWIPDNITTIGAFWATANTAALNAAIVDITSIIASGVDVIFNISYPGDTGLGAAGWPTSGTGKLSTIVPTYNPDGS